MISKEALNEIQLRFYAKYGQELGDGETYLLHEIQSIIKEQKSSTIVQLATPSHSLLYGLGKYLPLSISLVILGLIGYVAWTKQTEYQRLEELAPLFSKMKAYEEFAAGAVQKEYRGVVYVKLKVNEVRGSAWSKGFEIGRDAFLAGRDSVIVPIYTKVE